MGIPPPIPIPMFIPRGIGIPPTFVFALMVELVLKFEKSSPVAAAAALGESALDNPNVPSFISEAGVTGEIVFVFEREKF